MGIPPVPSPRNDLENEGIPMPSIVLKVRYAVKERLLKALRKCRDAGTRLRHLVVLNVLGGRSARDTATALKVHPTTVYRVVRRFRAYGEAGLCRTAGLTTGTTNWTRPTCSACTGSCAARRRT